MSGGGTRYLYVARHGEALPDESGLTQRGRRQAVLLGRRLRDVPLAAVHHGPLARARETARLVAEQLDGVPATPAEEAGDYVPHVPDRSELPLESADLYLRFLSGVPAEDRERGPELARRAVERFTGTVAGDEDRHELVVTHAFLVAWLIREAMRAPKWRWLGALDVGNAALTVLRHAPGRPPSVLLVNDMRHLPADLRWTGFPTASHV